MAPVFTSSVTKKLVLQYVMENIEIRKRSNDLLEIILIGKKHQIWMKALTQHFEVPASVTALKFYSNN